MSSKTINSWDWDIRVRDRHMKNGVLADKDVEKFLSQLPDLVDLADSVSLSQPALSTPHEDDDDEDEAEG